MQVKMAVIKECMHGMRKEKVQCGLRKWPCKERKITVIFLRKYTSEYTVLNIRNISLNRHMVCAKFIPNQDMFLIVIFSF